MKQKLFNLTLSTLFVAVLAACGSSKSEDMVKPDSNDNTTQPDNGQKPDAGNQGESAANDDVLKQQEIERQEREKYLNDIKLGFANLQTAKSRKSEFGSGETNSEFFRSRPSSDQSLDRALDTIVLGTIVDEKDHGKRKPTYLEDFQFDGEGNANIVLADGNRKAQAVITGYADAAAYETAVKGFLGAADTLGKSVNNGTKASDYSKGLDKYLKGLSKPASNAPAKDKADYALKLAAVELLKLELNAKGDQFDVVTFKTGVEAKAKLAAVLAGYLEFSSDTTKDNAYRKDGIYQLSGIYVNGGTTGDNARGDTPTRTETKDQGSESGMAYVYQYGRRIYFTDDNKAADKEGVYLGTRDLNGTVAEVYGNKTFTFEHGRPDAANGSRSAYNMINDGGANAPFQKTKLDEKTKKYSIEAGRLTHVQYGRVTSQIDNIPLDDLKGGVKTDTKVAAFGEYGEENTEDHYFARGTGKTQKLSDVGASGKVTYQGHALSRGLDDSYAGSLSSTPNAVSAGAIVSGNHVVAELDLSEKKVIGSVYNIWEQDDVHTPVALVRFEGEIGANANMAGKSWLTYRDDEASKGEFHAALYGDKGQELGGKVQSVSNDEKLGWVSVFGASRQDAAASSSFWTAINDGGTAKSAASGN